MAHPTSTHPGVKPCLTRETTHTAREEENIISKEIINYKDNIQRLDSITLYNTMILLGTTNINKDMYFVVVIEHTVEGTSSTQIFSTAQEATNVYTDIINRVAHIGGLINKI